jgi:uncharacterized protein YciW
MGMDKAPDFQVEDHGTIVLVRPQSEKADEFVAFLTDVQPETLTFGSAIALDHRMALPFLRQLTEDGYSIVAGPPQEVI